MKHIKRIRTLLLILSILLLTGMTGCGKKEKDPNSSEVMKLQLTPEPTPTAIPKEAEPKAVSSKGSVKMVNEYLDRKLKEEAKTAEEASTIAEDEKEQDENNKD